MLSSRSLLFTRLVVVVVDDVDDDGVFFFLRLFFFFLFDVFEFKEQIPRKYEYFSLNSVSLSVYAGGLHSEHVRETRENLNAFPSRKARKESSGASEWVRFSRVSPKCHEKV